MHWFTLRNAAGALRVPLARGTVPLLPPVHHGSGRLLKVSPWKQPWSLLGAAQHPAPALHHVFHHRFSSHSLDTAVAGKPGLPASAWDSDFRSDGEFSESEGWSDFEDFELEEDFLDEFRTIEDWEGLEPSDLPVNIIKGYGNAVFRVNDCEVHGSVVVSRNVCLNWSPSSWEELTPEHFAILEVMESKPDVVLIGTGNKHERLTPELEELFERHGIAVQTMKSNLAMGTCNVLQEEHRNFMAFLLPFRNPRVTADSLL